MRVLIADDHPMVADALSVYLREVDPDTEITISQSLDQALSAVREESRDDVVFLVKNMHWWISDCLFRKSGRKIKLAARSVAFRKRFATRRDTNWLWRC